MDKKHDVRQLAGLDEWQLEDADKDLRGHMLKTPDGEDVGKVDDMLADMKEERITALRLEDGRLVNIEAVDLIDGHPVLFGESGNIAAAPDGVGRGEYNTGHIPIVEERLDIGMRKVDLGMVRINTRVVSETVGEDVSLQEERVSVNRRDMNEKISAADADKLFQDDTIELEESGERAVVSKNATVTGEVVVDKDVDTRTERVERDVRHTEVDVERGKSSNGPAKR